jgi:very-long-chain (3R)-3-hydroxyacyl-CoA dehydratase
MISLLEVFHALFGLVRGSPFAALLQWTGRANVLFNVVLPIETVCSAAPAGAVLLAWCLSEVVRYPWYAAQISGTCPFWWVLIEPMGTDRTDVWSLDPLTRSLVPSFAGQVDVAAV